MRSDWAKAERIVRKVEAFVDQRLARPALRLRDRILIGLCAFVAIGAMSA